MWTCVERQQSRPPPPYGQRAQSSPVAGPVSTRHKGMSTARVHLEFRQLGDGTLPDDQHALQRSRHSMPYHQCVRTRLTAPPTPRARLTPPARARTATLMASPATSCPPHGGARRHKERGSACSARRSHTACARPGSPQATGACWGARPRRSQYAALLKRDRSVRSRR